MPSDAGEDLNRDAQAQSQESERNQSSVERALRDAIDDLVFMKDILSWKETWIPMLAAVGWTMYMLVFAYAHYLSNPWRSIVIWGITLGLAVVAPGVLYLSRGRH